ncbi:hypothetical protein D3C80_1248860 [compost metagenome]
MRCWPGCRAKGAAGSRCFWAQRRGWARPTPCSRPPMPRCARACRCWRRWSKPMVGPKPNPCSPGWRNNLWCARSIAVCSWKRWTSMACSRPRRNWRWSTNWPTATRPAVAMPNAGRMCKNCWLPVSMSTPRSTFSTWKVSTTRCAASPACRCVKPCRTGCCRKPSNWC